MGIHKLDTQKRFMASIRDQEQAYESRDVDALNRAILEAMIADQLEGDEPCGNEEAPFHNIINW